MSHRIPEITDDLYKIDRALCAGFGWEIGPFQMDALDVVDTLSKMEEEDFKVANWVYNMVKSGKKSFYTNKNGTLNYYNVSTKEQKKLLEWKTLLFWITSVKRIKFGATQDVILSILEMAL